MDRISEYDAFGPWIYPVRGIEDTPRLYRDHPLDLTAAELVLKVPRNIARRDATADMDLYDHLIVLGPDTLTVLSRSQPITAAHRRQHTRSAAVQVTETAAGPEGYSVWEVSRSRIAFMEDSLSLVDGRVVITADDGRSVTVPYNGSATKPVMQLIDALRSSGTRPAHAGPAPVARDALGPDELAVLAAYAETATRFPSLRAVAMHARRPVVPGTKSFKAVVTHASHLINPATLQALAVTVDEAVVEVFGRREALTRGRAPVLSTARTVMRRSAVSLVQSSADSLYRGVDRVLVQAEQASLSIPVPAGGDVQRVLMSPELWPAISSSRRA